MSAAGPDTDVCFTTQIAAFSVGPASFPLGSDPALRRAVQWGCQGLTPPPQGEGTTSGQASRAFLAGSMSTGRGRRAADRQSSGHSVLKGLCLLLTRLELPPGRSAQSLPGSI